ncbi:Ninjurin-1 [Pitangus sulphuratus]|nr:Ninjurin-1 [Pitangus sulphuratus]
MMRSPLSLLSSRLNPPSSLSCSQDLLSRIFSSPSRYSLQHLNVLLVVRGPKPNPAFKGLNPHLRINGPMNINHYATKKSVAESMLDVALFMANVTQLKAVLEQGASFQYYATLIVLISISLFFQVMIGILLIITARLNLNDIAKQPRLNVLNNAATALIFITVILNIFITAFGVQKTGLYPNRNFRPY